MEELYKAVKRKCKVTWDDIETDERIAEITENAVEVLRHKLGMCDAAPRDFLIPGIARTLFENYCMYDWNNMLQEFDKNYIREILAARHIYEVKSEKKE